MICKETSRADLGAFTRATLNMFQESARNLPRITPTASQEPLKRLLCYPANLPPDRRSPIADGGSVAVVLPMNEILVRTGISLSFILYFSMCLIYFETTKHNDDQCNFSLMPQEIRIPITPHPHFSPLPHFPLFSHHNPYAYSNLGDTEGTKTRV